MALIVEAAVFAVHHHYGQTRKYTGLPYFEHPMRVAGKVSLLKSTTEEMVAAAWLHDVLEDTSATIIDLRHRFPKRVGELVDELTNPSKLIPYAPREKRKALDRRHISEASPAAKSIKAIDRSDNLLDMRLAPLDFRELYAHESTLLAMALDGADPDAMEELFTAITEVERWNELDRNELNTSQPA